MRLLFRMSSCTHGMQLCKLKLAGPKLLWLEHRATLSAVHRRRRQSIRVKSSVHPALGLPLRSAGPVSSLLPRCPLTGLLSHPAAGPALTAINTPVAFFSSSAGNTEAPVESEKSRTEAEKAQTPTTVPLEDVRRILRLAHPERWSLTGKL